MSEKVKEKGSAYREASTLLEAALAQLNQIRQAAAKSHSPELDAVAGRAKDAVSTIRSAMESGSLDAASLASLSASLNLSVDVGALVIEETDTGQALARNMQLATESLESRATVERLSDEMFHKHLFESDVARHTHGAELEAFRRREAEDERYVREQLGKHTAEGNLNASGKMEGYMLDANAHGAGDNPEFLRKWNELKWKTDHLRASMRAAGKNTEEYDKKIKNDVSDFLKSKGLSDRQIQQALAKNENPLDAVQPYLRPDDNAEALVKDVRIIDRAEQTPLKTSFKTADVEQPLTIDVNAMNARLAAAGLAATSTGDQSGHGLTIQKPRANVIEH
jgi:hypothetical protein